MTITSVPFVDLLRSQKKIELDIDAAMKKVIASAAFIQGQAVAVFEKEFAAYCGKKYGVGVGSGTDALHLVIRAYRIKESEIITTANTFVATVTPIKQTGNLPVLVDVDETGNINIAQIEKKITSRTKAIIPVHLYGQPTNMEELIRITKKYNLIVIEDCCQAHGAEWNSKKVPISETGCFSFYPAKNLGAFGDGGIIVTDNEEVASALKYLREYGAKIKYHHDYDEGFNSRLDTLQAAILSVKLKKLEEWNELRGKAARCYSEELALVPSIYIPKVLQKAKHVYHLFTILSKQRDALKEFLKNKGIGTGIYYPVPLHKQKMFAYLGYKEGDFPKAEQFCQETLSLPLFPYITQEEIEYVCLAIKEFYKDKN